jgi:2-polyprenyl-6-methoxyphenol hydroxylase-like FAD-dependent oxidoreductase
MTTAIIVGGGIAGTACAIALHKAGISADVYEAHTDGADDLGAFLTIMHNGMDALHAIDVHNAVIDVSFPAADVEFYGSDGQLLSRQPMGSDCGTLLTPRTIRRSALYTALHEQLRRRGGHITHGKRLYDVETPSEGGVRVTFEDGTQAQADLLIGADGIHSTARTLLNPTAQKPRYTGLNIVYGYTPNSPVPTPDATYRMITGSRAYFGYTTDPRQCSWWFARIPGDELDRDTLASTSVETWKRRFATLFAEDETPAAKIIQAAEDDVTVGNAYDVPTTERWHNDTTVLIGDAAHAASPAAGQGASMALEDAVILAQCLRDLPDRVNAFRVFEAIRRERVERLVVISADQGASQASAEDVQRRPQSRAWLYEHHIEWNKSLTTRL